MAQIVIENLESKSIHCKDKTKKLLDILLAEIDWMHACGAKGRCTTCKAIVVEGMESLTEITESEQRFRKLLRLKANERLSCQVDVKGDVKIRVAHENKLPHINYSD
ncbi:MAG: (2Fe-2S)-binding protein [Cyclobacteriaceae bacterium]|nr:(2Fe-2S)-binding protein [Cyclobacteriaceae bacterium HetDA_MAG_MS6]